LGFGEASTAYFLNSFSFNRIGISFVSFLCCLEQEEEEDEEEDDEEDDDEDDEDASWDLEDEDEFAPAATASLPPNCLANGVLALHWDRVNAVSSFEAWCRSNAELLTSTAKRGQPTLHARVSALQPKAEP